MAGVIDLIDYADYTEEEPNCLYGDVFYSADEENTSNLLNAYYKHNNVEPFLRNEDTKIPLFPTTICHAKDNIRYSYDIDGIVIQFNDLAALKARLHFLLLGKAVGQKLNSNWHVLKKHLPLRDYSAEAISALHKTFGHKLGFVDGGYMLRLSVISALTTNQHPFFKTEVAARANAAQIINSVIGLFTSKFKALGPEQLQRPTIKHTNLNNLKKMVILEEDQSFVLGTLMEAVQELNRDPTQKLIVFLTRFGQKAETPLSIGALLMRKGVHSITCHATCSINAKDPRVDLMWSHYGLQNIVGHRGSLFSVYGMAEAANFQSSLDRHNLTLDHDLMEVFNGANTFSDITFVKIYATTPRVRR
ncbi:hypothetical protein QQF64_031195 [Cirrhinus molitorella]|uniref:Uncharacterized protein n=1 Tax=Cirrhinus molitorella TaxID=172907 RepID=A0ABR3MWC9_9TELE